MMPDTAPPPIQPVTPPATQPSQPPVPQSTPMQKPPELTKTPAPCNACDMMVSLGLLTSSCESITDPTKRASCKTLLKPLEEGKGKAVDVLANVIVEMGEDHLDDVVERMNILLFEATAVAKDKLIAKGVLNKDGTQKV